jgi:hypothetical protein
MLHYKTIDPPTLELLKHLLELPVFNNLRLVGGTSLALQLGHRKSVDIDLFGVLEADEIAVSNALKAFENVTILQKSANINIYTIEGIKVDIVNYSYPWLAPANEEDDLQLAHLKDIAAMKLSAITGRGTKKDFIDIYFLSQIFSLKEMLEYYKQKYFDGSEFLVIKSLTYFEDADPEQSPVMLHPVSWEEVQQSILTQVASYT